MKGKIAFLGDIHGNYDAFEAVLNRLKKQNIMNIVCTGDIVGFGAEPGKCIRALRDSGAQCVAGDFDWAVCGKLETKNYNEHVQKALEWTKGKLSADEKAWLAALPLKREYESFTVAHGGVYKPENFNYISVIFDAELNFKELTKPILFYGHTHIPLAFINTKPMTYTTDQTINLASEVKALVNVGSCGLSWSDKASACCAIYDAEKNKVETCRVPYDCNSAWQKMRDAGIYDWAEKTHDKNGKLEAIVLKKSQK